jgi:hypothetical protein
LRRPQRCDTGPGIIRIVLPRLLEQSAHAREEAFLGIPVEDIVILWAEVAAEQAGLADKAFTLLAAVR